MKKKRFTKIIGASALALSLGATMISGGVLLSGCTENENSNAWIVSETAPETDSKASVGQMYLDTSTYNIYQMTNDGWKLVGNIKGDRGNKGNDGEGSTIAISYDGFWIINGQKTNVRAIAEKGEAPTIRITEDGYWEIAGQKTNIKARGEDAQAPTISINNDGFWVINGTVTTVKARGENGHSPVVTINDSGYWVIDGEPTTVKAKGEDGQNGASVAAISISYVDKWGIQARYEFTLSNEDSYIVLAPPVVDPLRTYVAENTEDVATLTEYGVASDKILTSTESTFIAGSVEDLLLLDDANVQDIEVEEGTVFDVSSTNVLKAIDKYGISVDNYEINEDAVFTANTTGEVLLAIRYNIDEENISVDEDASYEVDDGEVIDTLLAVGVKNIDITDDVSIDSSFISSIKAVQTPDAVGEYNTVTFNLNGNKLSYSSIYSLVITNGIEINIQNGMLNISGQNVDTSAITVETGAKLHLEDIEYTCVSTNILPIGTATVELEHCSLVGHVYCVSTNANSPENYNPTITISNSQLRTLGWGYVDEENTDNDDCPILMNVPGTLTIANSRLIGNRQGLIVRGGEVVMENSEIICTAKYSNKTKYLTGNWGSGNEVPMASVVVGNRSKSSYRYPATLTLNEVYINTQSYQIPDIYVYGNSENGKGATLNLEYVDYQTVNNYDIIVGENATVNSNLLFVQPTETAIEDASQKIFAINENHYKKHSNGDTLVVGEDVTLKDFYVEVASVYGVERVDTVKFKDFEFTSDYDLYLSVGNNAFIKGKAFYFEDNKLYAAAPIVTVEMLTSETVTLNGLVFNTGEKEIPTIEISEFKNSGSKNTVSSDDYINYNLTVDTSMEYVVFGFDGVTNTDNISVTKKLTRMGDTVGISYGLSPTEDRCQNYYGMGYYEIGYSQNDANVNPNWDGAVTEYTIFTLTPDGDIMGVTNTLKLNITFTENLKQKTVK